MIVHSTEHGSGSALSRDSPQRLEGFYCYRADISWLVLVGLYCACKNPMIFLDWPPGQEGPTMLIYYNAVIMKQGSCSISCAGAVMIHCDSVLFQKAGTTCLRTGSLSCSDVLGLGPGAPPELFHS